MGYSAEKNVLVLVALMKAHRIRHVIASPGSTNSAFVASLQHDSYFQIYSAVDERSAAYMACGLTHELGLPVALSCTGATASRNYLPGMTEAFYRKLPVLAVTSSQAFNRVGHIIPQVIDRSLQPKDAYRASFDLPIVSDNDTLWECKVKANAAILELTRRDGGPVHLNLPTSYDPNFSVRRLPEIGRIERLLPGDTWPALKGRVNIILGSHREFAPEEITAIDAFCKRYGAVVVCDHTGGYRGKFRLRTPLAMNQDGLGLSYFRPDISVHIGEVSGDYSANKLVGRKVWRVSRDGEIRDTFRKLEYVFEVGELEFFCRYAEIQSVPKTDSMLVTNKLQKLEARLQSKVQDVPFSNIWMASVTASQIPPGARVHFGILNSLRSWNLFDLPPDVRATSNVGGFGIDGNVSSLIGASLSDSGEMFLGVFGDLAFFYDLNAIGNRHVGGNVRILLVNNGTGTEFGLYNHRVNKIGISADQFMSGSGHFGEMSRSLVKQFTESLGFKYLAAENKEEYLACIKDFLAPDFTSPVLLEAFVNSADESEALRRLRSTHSSYSSRLKGQVNRVLGPSRIAHAKRVLRR